MSNRGKSAQFLADHEDKLRSKGKCKLWTGATNSKGYPKATVKGKQVLVHRHVLELKLGRKLGKNKQAGHKCGKKTCVSPRCLHEVTQSENEADKKKY